ncbi:TetR/AcrR family transcriptional regulator [Rhodococcus aerolatus]
MKRTRLSPEARRAQLIDLGVQMLSSRTLDELSVEEIADRAGISRGLLFHYFASKQDYRVAVVQQVAQQMLELTAPDPALDPLARLHASVASFVDYVSENRDAYVSLLRGGASEPALQAVLDATRTEMARRTVEGSEDLGIPTTTASRLAVRGWIAFTEEVVVTWLTDPTASLSRDELLGLLVTGLPVLARGVTEPGAPA